VIKLKLIMLSRSVIVGFRIYMKILSILRAVYVHRLLAENLLPRLNAANWQIYLYLQDSYQEATRIFLSFIGPYCIRLMENIYDTVVYLQDSINSAYRPIIYGSLLYSKHAWRNFYRVCR